jgi:hypothetical protein
MKRSRAYTAVCRAYTAVCDPVDQIKPWKAGKRLIELFLRLLYT